MIRPGHDLNPSGLRPPRKMTVSVASSPPRAQSEASSPVA